MNNFKDFNIKPEIRSFVGDKIPIKRVLNKEIKVLDFKIESSKQKIGTECLTLQIEKSDEKRIVFTGSKVLIEMIRRIDKDKFPFKTTIVEENEHYEFT